MMRRSIVDYTFREIAFRAFLKLGLKTRSEAHLSTIDRAYRRDVPPLLVTGLPRSGTTTLLHKSADMLGYNALFEPLVFNHLNFEEQFFSLVGTCFRGNPSVEELLLQDAASGLFSDIIKIEDATLRHRAQELLFAVCGQMLERCGSSIVVKELRWIANLDLIDEAFTVGELRPKHLFIDPDPLMVLYTHYRLGGLSEINDFNNLAVNEMYERKVRIARKRTQLSELSEYSVRNKWEKLLVSVMIDRRLMADFAEKHSSRVRMAGLGELLGNLEAILGELEYQAPDHYQERQLQKFAGKRYLEDRYFLGRMREAVSDQVYQMLGEKLDKNTNVIGETNFGIRRFFTHCAVKIAES